MFGLSFRLGFGLLFVSLGRRVRGHFMTFISCPYFLPEVMVKLTRKARRHCDAY